MRQLHRPIVLFPLTWILGIQRALRAPLDLHRARSFVVALRREVFGGSRLKIPSWLKVALVIAGSTSFAKADIKLPAIFSNHMILEKAAKVPIWGKADLAEEITVTFAGQTSKAKASADGKWKLAAWMPPRTCGQRCPRYGVAQVSLPAGSRSFPALGCQPGFLNRLLIFFLILISSDRWRGD